MTKTELVWPGKYEDDGTRRPVPRVRLPSRVIERFGGGRQVSGPEGEALAGPEESGPAADDHAGWHNQLYWGDNLLVMGSLLDRFAGKIDLIYIDPPFATGSQFSVKIRIGEAGESYACWASRIQAKAYRDTWGRGRTAFLQMIFPRLALARDLLSDRGTIYVHCDMRMSGVLRLVMDELFGEHRLLNVIAWCYRGGGTPARDFAAKHDTILRYAKGDQYKFNLDGVRIPYSEDVTRSHPSRYDKSYRASKVYSGYQPNPLGKHPEDWWEIQPLMPSDKKERLGYPTQKPESVIQRIVRASSDPGDLVADFFCGSGTTLAVAEKLGRRWIGCDQSRWAIHVTRKRLLEIDGWDPFELLDLGGHDRRHWHQVAFGGDHTGSLARPGGSARRCAAHEYRAYLVRCYGGQPVPGRRYVHGEKGPALIHVGPVDSPVTLRDIRQAIAECARLGRAELHVLGWEWEMASAPPEGIRCPGGPTRDEARRQGLKLALLQIPREVTDQPAASPSPFAFVELACPKVAVRHRGGLRVDVALTDFVFPTADLIPQEVQAKITKWSDYIDSWAVDWDFQEDAFHPAWASYRTPRDRTLALHSDPHTYRKPGKYQIAVKVTDIFGCDVLHAQFVPKALWEDG